MTFLGSPSLASPSLAPLNHPPVQTAAPGCVHHWLWQCFESQLHPHRDSFVFPAEHKIPCSLREPTRRPRGAGPVGADSGECSAPNGFSLLKANTRDNSALQVGARMEGTELLQGISSHRRTLAGAVFSAIWKGLWNTDPALSKSLPWPLLGCGLQVGISCPARLSDAFRGPCTPPFPAFLGNSSRRICALVCLFIPSSFVHPLHTS